MDDFARKVLELKSKLLEEMAAEIKAFNPAAFENGTQWSPLIANAQLQFMKDIYVETSIYSFREDELNRILESNTSFLNACWIIWNKFYGTVAQTVTDTIEYFVQDTQLDG